MFVGIAIGVVTMENSTTVSQVRHIFTTWSSNFTPRNIPKKNVHKSMYTNAQFIISIKWKKPKSLWIDKQNMI